MRVYEVYVDCEGNVFKTYIAARNKKELMRKYGDSEYFVKVSDVTLEYDLSKHKGWQMDLECSLQEKFNIGEVSLIENIVEEYIDKANKKKEK